MCIHIYILYIYMNIYMHIHTDMYIISYILFTVTSLYRITSDYFEMEEDEIQKNVLKRGKNIKLVDLISKSKKYSN